MANWSDTEIELNGSKENIKLCTEEIKRHLEDDTYGGTWLCPLKHKSKLFLTQLDHCMNGFRKSGYRTMLFLDIDNEMEFKEDTIKINGQGKNCSPYMFIQDLVEKYSLSGYMFDMECGNQWCSLQEFENGVIMKDITEDFYFCQLSIDVKGIDYWLVDREYIFEELVNGEFETFEEWYECYEYQLDLFEKNGYTLEKLLDKYEIDLNKLVDFRKVG